VLHDRGRGEGFWRGDGRNPGCRRQSTELDQDLIDPELLPLFLEEAGDRVERILELVAQMDLDRDVPTRLRRELHALKGASRMMGLGEITRACHETEDLFEGDSAPSRGELEIHGDRLRSLVEALAAEGVTLGGVATSESAKGQQPVDAGLAREELRVASETVDDMADRGARLRVVAAAAEKLGDRIFGLAALAEKGVGDRDPRQVLAALSTSLRQLAIEFEGGQRTFRRLSDRQLEALLRLQVQPLKPFLRSLAAHARELADSLGKKAEVQVQAGDAQLDRRIVNTLREAFLHLVRNAVDHGIEVPHERQKLGKEEIGNIRIEAEEEGDRVRIRVVDDGHGIDIESVIESAVDRELIPEEAARALDESEALQFLFRPGFTTREETSELSGRGIGLDAVAASVRGVGGDVWMKSHFEEGTEVTVEVPVARRGERVLAVEVGRFILAVPASPVRVYRLITRDMIEEEDGRKVLRIRGKIVEARFLSDLFGDAMSDRGVMVEMIVGGGVVAMVADSILGEEEVIVRPLSPGVAAPDFIDGIALLANGRPVPVFSPQSLRPHDQIQLQETSQIASTATPIQVLLVDDSRVTREMVKRLLEDAGFRVKGAESADDALLALGRERFDCLVTDIEMPEVDGLELTRKLRQSEEFADLPIVVVSTLDRPSDRLAGLESGADAYLTKQGLDARELVALIYRVGGGR
jgi:chemotaxis protein histidine kinase CheA/ActR/RegA family two-component response regulator